MVACCIYQVNKLERIGEHVPHDQDTRNAIQIPHPTGSKV